MNQLSNLSLKNKIFLGIIGVLLVLIPVTVLVVSKTGLNDTRSHADLSGDINILSKQLLSNQGSDADQVAIAIQRKELVKKLARTNPENFLLNTITPDIKKSLPALAQEHIETKTEITGNIVENVAEVQESDADPVAPFTIQVTDDKGNILRAYDIYLREGMIISAGQKAKIQGYAVDNILVPTRIEIINSPTSLDPESQTNITGQNVLGVSTTGNNKKVAVVMVNFKSDKSDVSDNFTRDDLAEIYFTGTPSTTKYLKSASSNQISFQGDINDVYGWITIPNFKRADACEINEAGGWKKAAMDKARAQAAERGKNFDNYDFIGFILPYSNICDWDSAIAAGVGNVDTYAKPHHFLNGDYCAHSSNCNTKDKKFYSGLMAHEMGHNLGLSHANGLDCGTKIVDSYANCKSITYADRLDTIGGGWTYMPYPSAANQIIRLGWTPVENRKTVNESSINSTGNYTLYTNSVKQTPGNIQTIRIPRPVDGGTYFLEYRTKNGLDSDIPSNIAKGLIMRLTDVPNGVLKDESGSYQYRPEQSYLLDLSNSDPSYWADYLNASLRDGKTFEDTRNKIKITQLSHDEAAGTVNLKIELGVPPCVKANPGLSIPEPGLSGTANETIRYELTIVNNNSDSCPQTTFNMTVSAPSGWTATYTTSSLSIPSGESKKTYLDLTPTNNVTTASNPYITQVTAKNASDASFYKTKQVSFSIEESNVTNSPTPKPSSPTPTPTNKPSATPTPSLTPRPSATPIPTSGPPPTNTPSPKPGLTIIHFPSIKLHGIGTGGDNLNPNAIGNSDPRTKTRNLIVDIIDGSNNSLGKLQGNIIYQPTTGDFTGDIIVPDTINNGNYLLKVKSDKYLIRQLPGQLILTKGAINNASSVDLITGDSNLDGKINILDFNVIADCYSDFLAAKNCADAAKQLRADLNDDGKVNQADYNLYLRESSVQSGN